MPPVTLTAATLTSADAETVDPGRDAQPVAARLMFSTLDRPSPHRRHLRLVSSREEISADVHGRGGPASCTCRECTMARHPAFGPKLTLI